MGLVLLLVWIVFVVAVLEPKNKRLGEYLVLGSIWAVITLHEGGLDYDAYLEIFNGLTWENLWQQWTEPVFLLWMYLAKQVTHSFEFFNFLYGFVTVVLLKKIKDYYVPRSGELFYALFFLVYFLRYPIGWMRQGLAILLVIYALKFVPKVWKWLLALMAGACMHTSALAALPIFAVASMRPTRYRKQWLYGLCLLGLILIGVYGFYLVDYLPNFLPTVWQKLSHYKDLDRMKYTQWWGILMIPDTLRMVLVLLLLWWRYPQAVKMDALSADEPCLAPLHKLIKLYLFGVGLYVLLWVCLQNAHLTARISATFLSVDVLLLAYLYGTFSEARTGLGYKLLCFAIGGLYFVHELFYQPDYLQFYWAF